MQRAFAPPHGISSADVTLANLQPVIALFSLAAIPQQDHSTSGRSFQAFSTTWAMDPTSLDSEATASCPLVQTQLCSPPGPDTDR